MPNLLKTLMIAASLTLSGCTIALWGVNDVREQDLITHELGQDSITAFGQVRAANSQFAPGSLVMMGQRYWYVLNPEDSQAIAPVLNAGLPKRYQIAGRHTHDELQALPVEVESGGKGGFSSHFCLHYPQDGISAQEKTTLEKLGFKTVGKMPPAYRYCAEIEGKFYATTAQVAQDYRFAQRVPVSLYAIERKETINGGRVIGNVLLTPFTLALDAVGAVIAVPAMMLD